MTRRADGARAAYLGMALAAWSPAAMAAAWTQPMGEGQAINTLTYYVATQRFESDGDVTDSPRFAKLELSPYIEYGVTDAITIGGKAFFTRATQNVGRNTPSNTGVGDIELFARQRLWQGTRTVLSVQQLIKLPGTSDAGETPQLGRDQIDLEGRVLLGTSANIQGVSTFYDLQAGFRKRFEEPADEVRFDVTAGVKPTPDWILLAQSFNTIGLGNAQAGSTVQMSAPDFNRFKVQGSVVRRLNDHLSLQVGGFREYAGRNTGLGNAGFVALWIDF